MVVVFAIAIFVASEYFVIGVVIAIWAIASAILVPMVKGVRHILKSATLRRKRVRAVFITAATACAVVVLVFLIPFPLHTSAEGVIWLPETAHVRAGTDGFVRDIVARPGSHVAPGDLLLRSDEPLLATQIEVDRHKVQGLQVRLASERFADRVQA
jgi:putative peptide zinc metalloprotease protein